MQRREFLKILGGAVAVLPTLARAQQPERMRRIGVLAPVDDGIVRSVMLPYLATRGFAEGRNLVVDFRIGSVSPKPPVSFPRSGKTAWRAIGMENFSKIARSFGGGPTISPDPPRAARGLPRVTSERKTVGRRYTRDTQITAFRRGRARGAPSLAVPPSGTGGSNLAPKRDATGTPVAALSRKRLIFLASPRGFEPLLPP